MLTALIAVGIAALWCFTTWLAYRIGVGVGLTQATMAVADALNESLANMASAEAHMRAALRPNFEDRIDVN